MDELLIDEKKYVSSKQAAKITGYAKDYIGQLCREGRVPARLVGRSWYVLESAIQDHRFGDEAPKQKEPVQIIEKIPASSWTRQAPHYEASPVELIPKMREAEREEEYPSEMQVEVQAPENLQNSWKAWFDKVGETISSVTSPVEPEKEIEPVVEPEEEAQVQEEPIFEENYTQEEEVQIPIHSIYKVPPRELLPRYMPEEEEIEPTEPLRPISRRKKGIKGIIKATKVILILISCAFATLAIISTGYLDNHISSNIQVTEITGVSIYTK
jgi:hypothetical protein